jgi:hypothetical protein
MRWVAMGQPTNRDEYWTNLQVAWEQYGTPAVRK